MSAVAGGLRARLVIDSFTAVVTDALAALGWLDPGRAHAPIAVIAKPPSWDEPIAANTMAISARDDNFTYQELGSLLGTDTIMVAVDFFAENDALGVHVTSDLRDALRGRLPVGAQRGRFPVYDYRLATPAPIGYAGISDVTVERRLLLVQEEWARHLHSVTCFVEDTYYGGGD